MHLNKVVSFKDIQEKAFELVDSGTEVSNKIKLEEKIHENSTTKVYKASLEDGSVLRTVAVKLFIKSSLLKPFISEEQLHLGEERKKVLFKIRKNTPSHVVPFFDFLKVDSLKIEVMEYIERGSLHEVIQKEALSLWEILEIAGQIIEGILELKTFNVLYASVDHTNVLIGRDRGGGPFVFLTGFNYSVTLKGPYALAPPITRKPLALSNSFLAPEICQGNPYGTPSEVWSIGALIFFMLIRKEENLYFSETISDWNIFSFLRFRALSEAQDPLLKTIAECLRPRPEARISLGLLKARLLAIKKGLTYSIPPSLEDLKVVLNALEFMDDFRVFLEELDAALLSEEASKLAFQARLAILGAARNLLLESQKLEEAPDSVGNKKKEKEGETTVCLSRVAFESKRSWEHFEAAFNSEKMIWLEINKEKNNWGVFLDRFESFEELRLLLPGFKLAVVGALWAQKATDLLRHSQSQCKIELEETEPVFPTRRQLMIFGATFFLQNAVEINFKVAP